MEPAAPLSPLKIAPDSSQSTPITITTTFLLIDKLHKIQRRLSSGPDSKNEVKNLLAMRALADGVLEVAWQVTMKTGRLLDDIDYSIPRLEKLSA